MSLRGHRGGNAVAAVLRLLRVKGQRRCRVVEVAAEASSLSAGDVYILDTGRALFQWSGAGASKKERTRALELCSRLREERAAFPQSMPV